jgi:hypothetical protein
VPGTYRVTGLSPRRKILRRATLAKTEPCNRVAYQPTIDEVMKCKQIIH